MIMINLIFRKLCTFNQFSNLYILNSKILLHNTFLELKLCIVDHKILIEGGMSQNTDLGLSFHFMPNKGKHFVNF